MVRRTANDIIATGEMLLERLTACDLCPHECSIDRTAGDTGECGMSDRLKIETIDFHFGEEPPLSGTGGSGTVFMSGCSLHCKYCQNFPFSQQLHGYYYTIDELAAKMLEMQELDAHNINFVTPDHFIGHIVKAIGLARQNGLTIPIVYNSSGWQKLDILEQLDGIVDIYLVDMRYADNEIACNCSQATRYKEVNRAAVKEMFRQVGNLVCDDNGIAVSGILVRHLVLPANMSGSAAIFTFLAEEVSPEVFVSLMSQYHPAYRAAEIAGLERRITKSEFDKAVDLFYNAGLSNGFIQYMG